jgi:hypothetical protein
MPRTNSTDVDEVLDTSIDNLTPYVEVASDIVDDVAGLDPTISPGRLERLEKFYAAYLATAQDPRAESLSGASRSESRYDPGESGNASYLEVAISLDPTGVIRDAQKQTATLDVPDGRGIDSH